MEKEQAIKVIGQLLDDYRRDESNWEVAPKQAIYVEGYENNNTYTIEGAATWSECSACYDVGDEQIPYEYFEPELTQLDCHLKGYDINGNEVYNVTINENDL